MNKPIVIQNGNFTATLNHINPGEVGESAILYWTDGVANEWREIYPDMSTGLLRLALLVASADELNNEIAGTSGWFIQTNQAAFEPAAALMRRIGIQYPKQPRLNGVARTKVLRSVLGAFDVVDEGRERSKMTFAAEERDYAEAVTMLMASTFGVRTGKDDVIKTCLDALDRFDLAFNPEALEPMGNLAAALEFHGVVRSALVSFVDHNGKAMHDAN
jgi:hypothetical protein